jgi:chemotaxis protein MotB
MSEPAEEKARRRIVKKKKKHGHHGGAWKVAYADLVTALMALFMVLWLISQGDDKLKKAIASYFRSPGVFNTLEGGILGGPTKVSKEPSPLTAKDDEQALFSTAALLQKSFATRPEFSKYKDQIKIELTDEGLRIQILDKAERVSFASGRAELTPDAQAILTEIGHAICALPNPIVIGGHTDRHTFPAGSTYTNWELSADRANAARRALEAACVQPQQIRRIVGHADTELLVPSDPYAPANRRISIVVMRMGAPVSTKAPKDNPPADTRKKHQDEASGKPAPVPTASVPAGDESTSAASAAEKQAARARLAAEGSVAVGEPDAPPAHAIRARERRGQPPRSTARE